MTWLNVITGLLTLGAVARITRLITDDAITAPIRALLDRNAAARPAPDGRLVPAPVLWRAAATWAHCAWCASLWVAAAGGVAHWLWHTTTAFHYVTGVLTASHLVALGAAWLDAPPPPREIALKPVEIQLYNPGSPSAS